MELTDTAVENRTMLNRAAMILRPAQPYLDWAKSLDHDGMVPDPAGEMNVYLIPPFAGVRDEEFATFLDENFDRFFVQELHDWHTRESDWPQDRTLSMFRKWFHIEIHTIIEDMLADPLLDDGN